MKFFRTAKDGGEKSHVTGFFFIELKPLFSIVLLHFRNGTREAYHNHAFNALTWVLKGEFEEQMLKGHKRRYTPSFKPKLTRRSSFHKVFSIGDTYALSFRGPWKKQWQEYSTETGKITVLTHGRKVVSEF
jgi:predicted metal-dependent enzyme (double-stranded beta helix superfamily)